MNEIAAQLVKAERSFTAAERLLEAGDTDFAGLYGCSYIAQALLLSKGLSFSRHGQVISQYGLHFAKGEVLDRRFHKLLDDALPATVGGLLYKSFS